jgi:translocation and assembly module TamB
MSEPAAAPAAPRQARWRRRVAWTLGTLALALLVLVVAAGGGLWWSLRSDAGSAWVLSQLPGLKVTQGRGMIWGDYDAQRVEFAIPGGAGKVVLHDAGWRGMQVRHAVWAPYRARVVMAELHARRVDIELAPDDKKEPRRPPTDLRLPVALEVAHLQVGELHAAALGDMPVRDIEARVELGAANGAAHRIDALRLAWDRATAKGSLHVGADAPLPVDARLDLARDAVGAAPAWNASATLTGPLERPDASAELRARPAAGRPEQALSVRAGLRPFAAWPLANVRAKTESLDLSAFHPDAPVTALSGEASATTDGLDRPASVEARFSNAAAGRWNEGRLPVRELGISLHGRPDDPGTLELRAFDVEAGTALEPGGRVQGSGRWSAKSGWKLDAALQALQPSLLDARAPAMLLSGPLSAASAWSDARQVDVKAELAGRFAGRGPARAARVAVDASASALRIDVRELRAVAGGATAALKGVAFRDATTAPWQLDGQATLVDFDPAPWWPGRDSPAWIKGPNRLNAKAEFVLALAPSKEGQSIANAWTATRGHATVAVSRSVLAGVALSGNLDLRSAAEGVALASLGIDAAGNSVKVDGRLQAARGGAGDRWDMVLAAPKLEALAPLWRLAQGAAPGASRLGGSLNATAHVDGRWPEIASEGRLEAVDLRVGPTRVQRAQSRWKFDTTTPNASVDAQATLTQLALDPALVPGVPPLESARLTLTGTTRAHTLEVNADSKALPPAWTDIVNRPRTGTTTTLAAPAGDVRSVALLRLQGGAIESPGARLAGWRGSLQQLELRSSMAGAAPWLRTSEVAFEAQWAGGPMRLAMQPGRADLLGAGLRWERMSWQAGAGSQPAQLDAQAELEPLTIAPLLARVQPSFGWGGDLAVSGHARVRSAPTFSADVVLERQRGDLTVTDESGNVQALGLSDLRLGLEAANGTWNFTQGLAGKTLGVAAGAVVARTSPQAIWPGPEAPIQGVLEVQVANLGTWGPWVPAGWRLVGEMRTSASIGGRFGAPEYTGQMRGSGIGVRNFLEGVDVRDGDVAIALRGDTARIERFTARAGTGTVRLEGNATLGAAPKALVKLQADKFQLLGRVDRRIVTSGQAQLVLDRETLALDGKFGIDEGLFDFTRSDAPRLSDDVRVVRRKTLAADTAGANPDANPNANPAPGHAVRLKLDVSLGQQLRIRGRGIDSGLRGELQITSPGNRLNIAGTVQAVDGTYAAYAQKLEIDRGLITFVGPVENPRLDIQASRPNTDVRVGVNVTGTALNPRIRLFSEPEMPEIDKLSWLMLGRATEGLGRADTALLQRAAIALLSGEGEGKTTQLTKAIGLDDVSLRQTEGEVRETVISLGKQLSRRWYVGYERSLTTTAGTWQLIYRVAQRFTLRAQTGQETSLDAIWTWRWH